MLKSKLRIAHIGLGDIAQKAYLPITTAHPEIAPVLCTRNEETLTKLARQYRIKDTFFSIDELINSRPDAAMVHTATDGHLSVAKPLLKAGIPVFVDKPVSDSLVETAELFKIAREGDTALFTGFNRRHAPLISELKKRPKPRHIYWQKHRVNLPGKPRTFIFDDFIHVIDSLLFFNNSVFPEDISVHAKMDGKNLTSLQVQWANDGTLFSGNMNRISGFTEERVEFFTPGQKVQIDELHTGTAYKDGQRQELGFSNWESTLYKRGFVTMIDEWLKVARHKSYSPDASTLDIRTHSVCEKILAQVLARNN